MNNTVLESVEQIAGKNGFHVEYREDTNKLRFHEIYVSRSGFFFDIDAGKGNAVDILYNLRKFVEDFNAEKMIRLVLGVDDEEGYGSIQEMYEDACDNAWRIAEAAKRFRQVVKDYPDLGLKDALEKAEIMSYVMNGDSIDFDFSENAEEFWFSLPKGSTDQVAVDFTKFVRDYVPDRQVLEELGIEDQKSLDNVPGIGELVRDSEDIGDELAILVDAMDERLFVNSAEA